MRYDTALRTYSSKRIEEIEGADILVGIPCYYNQCTIAHVIKMVSHGLSRYYKDLRSVIMIADGGSTDDTREVAKEFQIKPWQEKITSIYRGPAEDYVASFINQTKKMTSSEAEAVVEEQAQVFEEQKDYLIKVWDKEGKKIR
ncbi:MAG: hypothetical protein ABIF87_06075 [Pseudomonadota bacterium]